MPLPALVVLVPIVIAGLALAASVAYPYTSNTMSDDEAWQAIINLLDRIRRVKPHHVYREDKSDLFYYVCDSEPGADQNKRVVLIFISHWYKSNEMFVDANATGNFSQKSNWTKEKPRDWLDALRQEYKIACQRSANAGKSVPA